MNKSRPGRIRVAVAEDLTEGTVSGSGQRAPPRTRTSKTPWTGHEQNVSKGCIRRQHQSSEGLHVPVLGLARGFLWFCQCRWFCLSDQKEGSREQRLGQRVWLQGGTPERWENRAPSW